jgi:hypothetical protein
MNAPPNMPGWEVIRAPVRNGNSVVRPAVTVAALSEGGRYRAALYVVFNPIGFGHEAPPAWLQPGSKVWALRGRGEFENTLRIMPNGPIVLSRLPRGPGCRLLVPALEGHPPKGARRTAVEFDFTDAWLDITLPAWHGGRAAPAPAPVPAAATRPQAAAPATKPFTLAAGASSHPAWASDRARADHERAVKGGGA